MCRFYFTFFILLYFYFYFFYFFWNHMIIVLRYKFLHAAHAMAKRNFQYPWEKANPPSPSSGEPIAYFAPNKKPPTSQEDR